MYFFVIVDEVLPVDSKSAPIVDDYDEQDCDPEAEDYPEENIEIDPVVEDEIDESDFSLVSDIFYNEQNNKKHLFKPYIN